MDSTIPIRRGGFGDVDELFQETQAEKKPVEKLPSKRRRRSRRIRWTFQRVILKSKPRSSKIEEGDEDDPFSSFDQPLKRRKVFKTRTRVVLWCTYLRSTRSFQTHTILVSNTGTDRSNNQE